MQRIQEAYGSEELRLLDVTTLTRAKIQEPDIGFLSEVGVPRQEQLEISFNLVDALPTLAEHSSQKAKNQLDSYRHLICLNEKYDILVGVDNESGGHVVIIDLADQLPPRFINTRVAFLVGFMAECVLHWKRWTKQGIPEIQSFGMMREWMESLDRPALEPNTFWSLVLEEMEPREGP